MAAAALVALVGGAGCSGTGYPVRTYRMGERVQLGSLVYNVYDSQWHTHLGDGAGSRIPENRFFLVRVSITNSGTGETMVPAMSVADDAGQSIQELNNGDRVPQWIGFLRSVKPAETIQGNLVFDCSPRHYKLQLTDENGQQSAVIDIPLTFTSEMPDVPVPELPQKK